MKICVLIDAWEPIWGGGQEHVWQICHHIVTHYPVSIDIFTRKIKSVDKLLSTSNILGNKNIRLLYIGPSTSFFNPYGRFCWLITVVWSIFVQHRQKKYDLIHGHAYLGAIPTKIFSLLTGVPCVFTVHGSNNLDLGYRNASYYFEKFLLTQIIFTKEISVTKHFLSYKNLNKNIQVIPNGISLLKRNSKKAKKNKKIITFLWIGRFDKIKGVDILLKSFAEAIKIEKNIFLQLVGYGYEKEYYKTISKSLKLDKKVRFYSKKDRNELKAFYQNADAFVLPSFSEGLSLTMLDAMMAQLPIIATNVGDNNNIIKEGINGYLIPPGNVSQLTKTIIKVARHKSLRKLGKNGHNLVKMFTWKRAGTQVFNVYKKVLDNEK